MGVGKQATVKKYTKRYPYATTEFTCCGYKHVRDIRDPEISDIPTNFCPECGTKIQIGYAKLTREEARECLGKVYELYQEGHSADAISKKLNRPLSEVYRFIELSKMAERIRREMAAK